MLKFLGSGGAFHIKRGMNCGYLELGSELFIFDMGADVFPKLINSGILKGKTKVNIFITHLHSDHVGSLGVTISYLKYKVFNHDISKICVYFPNASIKEYLDLQGVDESWYIWFGNLWDEIPVEGMDKYLEYGFLEAAHTTELNYKGENNCFSIEMEVKEEFTIFYSGDTSSFCDRLKNPYNYDFIYHEVTGSSRSERHLTYDILLKETEHFPREIRKKFNLMHLEEEFNIDQAIADGFSIVENETYKTV